MKFLILGSGGREASIVKSLYNFGHSIDCISNYYNKQILDMSTNYKIVKELYNTYILKNIILSLNPDIAIFGSEKFLELGLVDLLEKNKIGCIGPSKKLADIELSKSFTRKFLTFNNLNEYNPEYDIINSLNDIKLELLFSKYSYDFVIKDDGLCSGKGVKLFNNKNYKLSLPYIKGILEKSNSLYDIKKCLIEEKLYGEEFVLMSFCDGTNIKHMPIVKDFKKIKLGSDVNTGSIGCIVQSNHTLPFLLNSDITECRSLNEKVMLLLSEEKNKYKGILYGSFMKTSNGVKLIEYNARFGDPEGLAILSILKTDLGLIFKSIVEGTLDKLNIEYENKNVICKYLVPPGYPDFSQKNSEFIIPEMNNLDIYQAGLKYEENKMFLTGSRTLAIIKKSNGLSENHKDFFQIYNEIEEEINNIKQNLYYREDIGRKYNTLPNIVMENDSVSDIYLKSGVNITEGNDVVDKIKSIVMSTHNEYVLGNWGDFGGIFDINKYISNNKIIQPVLINSMDGVGTKSILAIDILGLERGLESLGQDIVNHSVNDIIVKGGKPLYFSDYVASDSISANNMCYLLNGMAKACKENNCVLIGGETAEMPAVYNKGHFDIVGNITGILDKRDMINGKNNIQEGDCIFGLLSLGPQTNGYSLIRYILENSNQKDLEKINYESLVRVHKSFYSEIENIRNKCKINGLCHITGGGFYENLPRVLPNNLGVEIDITILEPFNTLMKLGNISKSEMYRVFNCGYGMIIFVSETYRDLLENVLKIKYLGKVVKRGIKKRISIK